MYDKRKNCHTYNLRRRQADVYLVGERVWKKNYVLSGASKFFASKLAPKYVLCKVTRVLSNLVYQLAEDNDGRALGKWHVKDLKPYRGDNEIQDPTN